MAESKSHQLAEALNGFLVNSPDVEATAVISFDGLTMASALPDEMDEDRVGAMSAALLSLGEQAAHGLGRGELQQLFVEADEGYVFLMSARDEAVLVAVTGSHAKIGFILYEMRRAAWEVGNVLDSRLTLTDAVPSEHGNGELEDPRSSMSPAVRPESSEPGPPREASHEDGDAALVDFPDTPGPRLHVASDAVREDAVRDDASSREVAHDDVEHHGHRADARPVGFRDPFADDEVDDPFYVSTNGRTNPSPDEPA